MRIRKIEALTATIPGTIYLDIYSCNLVKRKGNYDDNYVMVQTEFSVDDIKDVYFWPGDNLALLVK